MAFINDYLTEEEIEKFRRLNISYGKKICVTSNEIVGTIKNRYFGGVICTIDRSNGMYLFYCGDDYGFGREELWSPEFFVFIQEIQDKIIVTKVGLEETHPNGYSQRVWNIYSINSKYYETNIEYDSNSVISDLKAALIIYGFDGDPREKDVSTTDFNF